MAFFTLRSQHTILLIIFAAVIPAIASRYYAPGYFDYAAGLAVFIVLFMIFGLYLNAIIQGPRYPHLEHTIRKYPTGVALKPQDFYIESSDPTMEVPDFFPLMERDQQGKPIPLYIGGRYFYPYLSITHWGLDIADFVDATWHIFVFPHPWNKFLTFVRRVEGAYLMGETYTHGSSEHLESYLAPFKVDFLGREIPIYLGIAATLTYTKITKDWTEAMDELAMRLKEMDAIIEQEKNNIFPMKQLEDMAVSVLPDHLQKVAIEIRERKRKKK